MKRISPKRSMNNQTHRRRPVEFECLFLPNSTRSFRVRSGPRLARRACRQCIEVKPEWLLEARHRVGFRFGSFVHRVGKSSVDWVGTLEESVHRGAWELFGAMSPHSGERGMETWRRGDQSAMAEMKHPCTENGNKSGIKLLTSSNHDFSHQEALGSS